MGYFAIGLVAAISCSINIVAAVDDAHKGNNVRVWIDILFAALSAVVAIVLWISVGFLNR